MSTLNFSRLFLLTISFGFLLSCKKDPKLIPDDQIEESNYSSAYFTVQLKSNNQNVIWDSLNNLNNAGNIYSVHNVNLYISNITMKRDDGVLFKSNQIFYIDPSITAKSTIHLDSIPKGNYIETSFLIGIDSTRNIDFGLNNTTDNLNMAWPTAMGGGYHFLKFEGHYLDTTNTKQGYAIHLGKNENLVSIKINNQTNLQKTLHTYSLLFNINEVFANPYLYNLNIDNNYTMSDSVAMFKIKSNLKDAFTITQNN